MRRLLLCVTLLCAVAVLYGAHTLWVYLPQLARDRLRAVGVTGVSGGAWCTVEDGSRFFSFRRDRGSGDRRVRLDHGGYGRPAG